MSTILVKSHRRGKSVVRAYNRVSAVMDKTIRRSLNFDKSISLERRTQIAKTAGRLYKIRQDLGTQILIKSNRNPLGSIYMRGKGRARYKNFY